MYLGNDDFHQSRYFFGHAIQTNCLLLPGFGLRSVTLRLTRPTRPSARGERLTRPLPRNSARQSSAQPTPLLDERVLSDGAGSCQVETSPRSRTTRPVWRRHGRRSSGPPTPLSRGRAAGAAARPRRRSRRSFHPSHRPFFLMKSAKVVTNCFLAISMMSFYFCLWRGPVSSL